MQLWLIPIFPLVGFALNGLFGRRISKPVTNAIAVGSVLLSFLWVLKTLSALGVFSGGEEALKEAYVEHYYTWIQSGAFNISIDFAVDRLSCSHADDRHRSRHVSFTFTPPDTCRMKAATTASSPT